MSIDTLMALWGHPLQFTFENPPGGVNGGGPLEGFLVEISIFTECFPIDWSMVLWDHPPAALPVASQEG